MGEQERPGEAGRADPVAGAPAHGGDGDRQPQPDPGHDGAAADAVRVEVLGRVRLAPPSVDRALGGGQARELLALLVARRGRPTTTTQVIDALWSDVPPATAPTIVHGLVRRIRRSLGNDVVAHDDRGYRLALDRAAVDLWALDEHLRAGDHAEVLRSWREPAFGVYHDRPWARDAIEPFAPIVEVDADLGVTRSRRRVPVSRLVGRRRELSTVAAAARRSRLVTIAGLGGVGKTRLALEVLRELRPDHDAHVDIGAAAGPAAVRLATELGLAPSGDPERDLRAVCSLVGRRSMVLLLDGCEHDLPGTAQAVEALLGTCVELRIIATSRLTLGVPGEHVVPLLPFADPGDPRGDAVELLLDRAQGMGLSVTAQDRARAAEICQRCAGVPLAVELGVNALLLGAGSDGGDGDGRGGDPTGPTGPISPERAVDEVIDHALAQLSDPTRRAAVRLSPLVAGFTPDLAAAVAPEGASATGILQELVASGLVVAETAGPTRRLRFLDRVRAKLHQRMASDDADLLIAALLDVFRAVRPDLEAPVVLGALGRAVAELPNGQALLDDLAARGRPVDRLALATSMADAWTEDGQWAHGERELAAALDAVRPARPGEPTAPIGWSHGDPLEPAIDAAPATAGGDGEAVGDDRVPVERRLWAHAVRAAGRLSGTYDGARRLVAPLTEAAEIARELDDLALETFLRLHLAHAHGYEGDRAAERAAVARLVEIAEALDNPFVPLAVESLHGLAAMVAGDHERAHDRLRFVAEQLEALDAPSDAARLGRNLAVSLRAAGHLDEALEALDRAERLALRAKARGLLATIRTDIADLQALRGRVDPEMMHSALEAVLVVGNLRAAGILRTRLGQLERDPAAVAAGTLDLLDADQRWAAVSLATLLALLPADHPLQAQGPGAVQVLGEGWGVPLDAAASALLEPYRDGPPAPLPERWEDELRAALRRVVAQGAGST